MSVEESVWKVAKDQNILVIRGQPWTKLLGTTQCEHSSCSCLGPLARAPS